MKPLLVLLPLALASCAALKKAEVPVTMRLSPSFAAGSPQPGRIAVAPVQGRGVTAGSRYAYVAADAPGEIRQARTLFWEEPPPRVLERALVAGLSTRFAAVSGPGLAVDADRRVTATLTRFEEVAAGADARALVAFDAAVTRDGKLLLAGRFCATAPIASADATIRARAFESAIGGAVTQLVAAVAAGAAPAPAC